MSKSLCKAKKSQKVGRKKSLAIFPNATHCCRKCGRVANSKKKLCKPFVLEPH